MKRTLLLFVVLLAVVLPARTQPTPNAWVNEIHYDNDGGDTGEFIELVIEDAGNYALGDFSVVLYNGNDDESYDTETVEAFAASVSVEHFSFYTWTVAGIQNGAPDGIALCYQGVPIQVLSYEGHFTASGGCADGIASTDISMEESGSTPVGFSLQLTGEGKSSYSGFSWTEPAEATPGVPNHNQTFSTGTGGNMQCPAGTEVAAKYDWSDGAFVFDGEIAGADDLITFSNVVPGDDGPVSADWSSGEDEIVAVVVKGGTVNAVTYEPAAISGTITNEGLSAKAISNVQYCVPPGDCPQSYILSDGIIRQPDPDAGLPGQFEVVFTNDSEGIRQVDFIDEDGALFLENLVVASAPSGFMANDADGLSWSHAGGSAAPQTARFVLEQADIDNTASRYFARITSACGDTFIDPPVAFEMRIQTPDRFALQGSYPNPSEGRATVAFELPESAKVRLVVHDVMGRVVATLVNRILPAGAHAVQWNGQSRDGQPVASGLYLFRLEAGSHVQTSRLTVVR